MAQQASVQNMASLPVAPTSREVCMSPSFQAIRQENLLRRPTMKSVIFRLPEQSPPNREDQQARFRQLYSARVVSDDADDYERCNDGHCKQELSPDFASPEASIKSAFFSPIEHITTPSSSSIQSSRDVFFTPQLASPTLIDDIQSSRSISELQKLKAAFGSDYPSLCRRTEARIQDLITSSPSSVLVGEKLITSSELHSLSTSVVSLGLSLSTEEDELLVHQQDKHPNRPQHPTTELVDIQALPTKPDEKLQLISPSSGGDHEYQSLLQSVEDLRVRNHTLQDELREQVSAHTKSAQNAQDTERHLQSQIQKLQESLGAATHQTKRERKFFMQVQENLNRRLKEAKERLQEASSERESIILRLRELVLDDNHSANVDELFQKARASMHEQEKANVELAKALETAQKEIRSAKDGKHKSEQLLTVATNRSRKLEVENKKLLSQVKTLSNELHQSRDKFKEAIEGQKEQLLKQWQEQEKRYMDTIHKLKKNIRNQANTVSMDLYRHAVTESKRNAEQCQYYQQRAKATAARIQRLERLVLSHTQKRQEQNEGQLQCAGTDVNVRAPSRIESVKVASSTSNSGNAVPPPPPPPKTKPLVVMTGKRAKIPPPPLPKTLNRPTTADNSQGGLNDKESNLVPKMVQNKQIRSSDTKTNIRGHQNTPKQVRFKLSHSPRLRSKGHPIREVTPPIPNKAPPEPRIRLKPSKENSWITPSRSSSSKLRLSLVRAAGGRLKLQSMLREKRQPSKGSTTT